jgi:hypothetical protein
LAADSRSSRTTPTFILAALPLPDSIEITTRWEFPNVLDNQKKDFVSFDSPLAGSRKMV